MHDQSSSLAVCSQFHTAATQLMSVGLLFIHMFDFHWKPVGYNKTRTKQCA